MKILITGAVGTGKSSFSRYLLVCDRCGMYFQSKSDHKFHVRICNAKTCFMGTE